MIQGKLYCFGGRRWPMGVNRELLSEKDMLEVFNVDHNTAENKYLKVNENVVYLDNAVMEFIGVDGKSYQTFIKVLTSDGLVGWMIWFKNEWQKVETNDSNIL